MAGLALGLVGMACSGGGAERSESSPPAGAQHATGDPADPGRPSPLAALKDAWPQAWIQVGADGGASLGQAVTVCGSRLVLAERSGRSGPWELRAISFDGRQAGPDLVVPLPAEVGDVAFLERMGQDACRVAVGWSGSSDSGVGAAELDGGWTSWSLPPSTFPTSEARWWGDRLLVGVVARASDRSLRAGIVGLVGERWSWELLPDADGLLGPSLSFAPDGEGIWVGAAGTGPQGGGALARVSGETGLEVLFSGKWLQEAATAVRSVAGRVIVSSPGAPSTGAAEGRIDVFRVEGDGLVLDHSVVGSELAERLGDQLEVGVDAGGPLVAATVRGGAEVRLYRFVDGGLALRDSVRLPDNAARLPTLELADLDGSGSLDLVAGVPRFGPDASEIGAVLVHFDPAPAEDPAPAPAEDPAPPPAAAENPDPADP